MSTSRSTPHTEEAPRSVTEVLCREVGAAHPDGALRQIRTMKRLLRSHYRTQQRLERYGVESLSDAVEHIAALTEEVRDRRAQQRRQARRHLTVIESLLDHVDRLSRSDGGAAPSPEPSTADADAEAAAPGDSSAAPLRTAVDLIDALRTELDELRLEVWASQSEDEAARSDAGEAAAQLTGRLRDVLQRAQSVMTRLRSSNDDLRARNERLQSEVDRLSETVEAQRARLQRRDAEPTSSSR